MKQRLLAFLVMSVLAVSSVFAQNRTIKGKVTGADDGLGLPGVSVRVKGTSIGASTGIDGDYSISVPADAKTLTFTYVGYLTQEIALGANGTLNVTLATDAKQLSEVVVTGYGTQIKKEFTGATAKVDDSQLKDRPMPSVDALLQGQVAGLQVAGSSGQPGANAAVRIRGIGSITAGSSPLYVVDGVIMNTGDFSRVTTTSSQLAGINPNDIESVSVLKDAAATSIYGSRGANGVIIINTKRGVAGKTKFAFSSEVGTTDIAARSDAGRPLTAAEWLELSREGFVNAGLTEAQVNANMNTLSNNGVATDWLDLVTRTGTQQSYNFSAQGGNEKTRFYASAGLFNQEAPVIASDLRRISGTLTLDHSVNKKITFGTKLNVSNTNQNAPSSGGAFSNPYGSAFFLMPTQNPYNADGTFNISRTGTMGFSGNFNPLYLAANDTRNLLNTKVLGSVNATYNITKGLKFSSTAGVDYFNIEEQTFWNPFHGDGRTTSGRGYNYYTRVFNWITTNQLTYQFVVPGVEDLNVNATVGYEAQKSTERDITTNATGYPPTTLLPSSIVAATPIAGNATGAGYTFTSILSSLNLNYKGKYSLSGTFRRDGSSRFGSNNRFGNFWSVGGAWNIDDEDFLADNETISTAKVRSSYGVNGNGDIGNYTWRPLFGYGINYNQTPGGAFNNIGNTDLTWELNKPFNVGLDLGFFRDRLTVTADYYTRTTSDLLLNRQVSRTTGFNSILQNVGEMKNRGFEFSVGGFPVDGQNFKWNTNFNITFNKNEVTSLPNGSDILDGAFILREGYDYRTYYVREYAGVNPANGNPMWYTDGTKTATTENYGSAQRTLVGSASPKFFGGFNNTFSYKGFTLDALINYNFGNLVRDSWEFYMMDGASPLGNKYAKNLDRWQKPGDITSVPKYQYNLQNSSSSFSTRFLYKGDYLRLRNVTLGYDLKTDWVKRVGLTKANLYVRGTNLLTKTFDDELTVDPEAGVNSSSNFDIPNSKSVTVGLNVNF